MRVLVINDGWRPFGGAPLYGKELLTMLADRGHVAEGLCFDVGTKPHLANVKTIRPPLAGIQRLLARCLVHPVMASSIRKHIRSFRPDVIHILNNHDYTGSVLWALEGPVVHGVLDWGLACPHFGLVQLDSMRPCEGGFGLKCLRHCLSIRSWFVHCLRTLTRRWFARKITALLSHASRPNRVLSRVFPRRKVKADYLMLSQSNMEDPGATPNAECDILFVGRLDRQKNVALLLEALDIFRRSEPDLRATIVGNGPQKEFLQNRSKELGLDSNVRFAGAIPRERIAAYYRGTRVLAVPTLWQDMGPGVIFDAWANGVPVVCAELCSLAPLVKRIPGGLVFDTFDKNDLARCLLEMHGDTTRARAMGERARKYVSGISNRGLFLKSLSRSYDRAQAAHGMPARHRKTRGFQAT